MRISDWSSDVCSSDLPAVEGRAWVDGRHCVPGHAPSAGQPGFFRAPWRARIRQTTPAFASSCDRTPLCCRYFRRSEEHTSELQSLMRISYAVFCLKKKKNITSRMPVVPALTYTHFHFLYAPGITTFITSRN